MPTLPNQVSFAYWALLLVLSAGILAGCSPNPVPPPPAVAPTAAEKPTLRHVSFEGIQFSYDSSLASEIIPTTISSRFGPDYAPWDQSPNHIAFQFMDPYTNGRQLYWQGFTPNPAPIILIYRTSDFPEPVLGWDGLAQVNALQALLQERPAETEDMIPLLPITNASQSFHAKLKYLDFEAGSGVRFITQYNQEARMVNNQEIFYTFQGMTNDGVYVISALLPVSAQTLPESHEVSQEEVPDFWAGFEKYIQEATARVNSLPDEAFDPNLAALDSIFESFSFP